MANDLTPMQSFQEKIAERLRDNIGEMIPPDALKVMVDKAIKDNLEGGWFREHIAITLKPQVNTLISDYLREHKEQIGKVAADSIVQLLPEIIAAFVNSLIQQQLYSWLNNTDIVRLIRDRIMQMR